MLLGLLLFWDELHLLARISRHSLVFLRCLNVGHCLEGGDHTVVLVVGQWHTVKVYWWWWHWRQVLVGVETSNSSNVRNAGDLDHAGLLAKTKVLTVAREVKAWAVVVPIGLTSTVVKVSPLVATMIPILLRHRWKSHSFW